MAGWQIILSETAQADRIAILAFWIKNNKSATYSKKLDIKFREAFVNLQTHPFIGNSTIYPGVNAYVVLNYKIFYRVADKVIFIYRIWDTRRNPSSIHL